jgi:hypothetical protein
MFDDLRPGGAQTQIDAFDRHPTRFVRDIERVGRKAMHPDHARKSHILMVR